MKRWWLTIELASDGSSTPDCETVEFHSSQQAACLHAQTSVTTGGCSHVGVFELVAGFRSKAQAVAIEIEK